jgi:hypothetical protein
MKNHYFMSVGDERIRKVCVMIMTMRLMHRRLHMAARMCAFNSIRVLAPAASKSPSE